VSLFDDDEQPSLFDELRRARAEGVAGMNQAAEHVGPEWAKAARAALIEYLRTHREMFTDYLWAEVLPPTSSKRALGSVVRGLVRDRMMVDSGQTLPRLHGHAARGPVWRSLIFEGDR
jgi:hypothetical protein